MIANLPDWTGTVPQWGMFLLFLLTAVKAIPILRKQTLDSQASQVKQYADTCTALRQELRELSDKLMECEDKCAQDIKMLHEEILGLRTQRLSEQGTIMRAILRYSNDPEVKKQLELLEHIQASLETATNVLQTQSGNVIHERTDEQGEYNA